MINLSNAGDQVWVAVGIYKPGGHANTVRSISFSMKNGVAIYGGFSGTETRLEQRVLNNPNTGRPSSSTLSGEIGDFTSKADNSYHVIRNPKGINASAVLDGFVITAGNANGSSRDAYGGAMYNDGEDGSECSPAIRNCSFVSNSAATSGGAVYNLGLFGNASPLIVNCYFLNNSAEAGGAVYNHASYGTSNVRFINCAFEANATQIGGAVYNDGGTGSSKFTFTNCSFINNSASIHGGAIVNNARQTQVTNCSFLNNRAASLGGAMYTTSSTDNDSPVLTNCVFFGNGGQNTFSNVFATIRVSYSLFEPSVQTARGFVSVGTGNLTTTVSPFAGTNSTALLACSPAMNAGLSSASGLDGISTDVVGNPRVALGRVDMGAYESQDVSSLTVSITATPGLTIARGASLTLTASGAGSYRWSTGATTSSVTVTPLSATTYFVTGTSGQCSAVDSVSVRVTCPNIIYVTQNGAGQQNGSGWDNAYSGTALQTAINAAADCNAQVWVAAGLYKPTTGVDRSISFRMRNDVAIYGGFLGIETRLEQRPAVNPVAGQPSSSTLTGEIGNPNSTADNSHHVLYNVRNMHETAVLDGFVITAGNASSGGNNDNGGGMYNEGFDSGFICSPTLRNCLFVSNQASGSGGAVWNDGRISGNSSPRFFNCLFQANTALGSGGAIYNNGMYGVSSPRFTNCSFRSNVTRGQGAYGGVMYNNGGSGVSSPQFVNCSFISNSSLSIAGVMINDGRSSGKSSPQLTNCSFLNNSAPTAAGVMYNLGEGGVCQSELVNCVLYGNGGINTFLNFFGSITANYCLIESTVINYTGANNLTTSTSPFVSATSGQVLRCSPAINAGLNSATGLNGITTDLAGTPRLIGSRVDMGAYESQSATVQIASVKNGDWDDSVTWECQRIPLSGDMVEIQHAVTLPASYKAQLGQILYRANGRLIFSSGAGLQLAP